MDDTRTHWIPFAVLSVLALVGVSFALRGEFAMSAVFALLFLGYTIIRAKLLLRRPLPGWSERIQVIGYVLVLAGILVFILTIIAQNRHS